MERLFEFAGNHLWLALAFIVALVLLIGTEVVGRLRRYKEISPAQATRLINRENAAVLDVRSANEYQEGHIAGARHMPVDALDGKEKSLKALRGRPLVVYCAGGPRGAKAAAWLAGHGMEPIYLLAGGIRAWQNEQFPVERGKA